MEQIDLHCSRGPVSSMPGSSHPFPEGSRCESHEDRPAVKRIQGETDSFGCEYLLVCQECLDAIRNHVDVGTCDICHTPGQVLRARRDPDEGSCGPVYRMCQGCRDRWTEYEVREAEANRDEWSSPDDFDDADDGDVTDYLEEQAWHDSRATGSRRIFRFRFAWTDSYVSNRDGSGYLELCKREADKFLRKHKGKVRGRQVFLQQIN